MEAVRQVEEALGVLADIETLIGERLAALVADGARVSTERLDEHQLAAYDYAHVATGRAAALQLLEVARTDGDGLAAKLAKILAADVIAETRVKLTSRPNDFGLMPAEVERLLGASELADLTAGSSEYQAAAALLASGLDEALGLDDERRMIRATFREYAETAVAPRAEFIHRTDALVPEEIIRDLSRLGCFGLSVPGRYGGVGDRPDYLGMVVVTEELSRASLGAAGSLMTRPEILVKALLTGGSERQRERWLPKIASGELMVAIAVTEPDYGSDVASIQLSAIPVEDGWRLSGSKIWSTFAGRAELLMVLARTGPGPGHRGLSAFVVEKPAYTGHDFEHRQDGGGRLAGRAIPTIGYRGMHSFELQFEDYFLPADCLIGEEQGIGRGFYLQMEGFAAGRLQTAGRALGVMQAAFDAALAYSQQRKVFGRAVFEYPLSQWKLARMAALIQSGRQLTYDAARKMTAGQGQTEASMAKLFTARAAEWVTREAQQLHGGMGYAEEFPVSRYFVDARVLSIFEGTEEILALRVIARSLLEQRQAERQGNPSRVIT